MASRKDVEAGKAHVLLYVKNQVHKGLKAVSTNLKQFAGQVKQVAEPLNQLSGIATRAGAAILGPMVAAVVSLKEAKKPLDDIKTALAEGIGRPLLPILEHIRDIVVKFSEWAKRNPDIIRTMARIGAILIAAGIAAKILASGLMLVAGAATIASVALSVMAFFLSPAGLIIAGVALLGAGIVAATAAWVKFTESGRQTFAALIEHSKPFFNFLRANFRGISDSLIAGDFSLSWEIALKNMEIAWLAFESGVEESFLRIANFIIEKWNGIVKMMLDQVSAITGQKFGVLLGGPIASSGSESRLAIAVGQLGALIARAAAGRDRAFGIGTIGGGAAGFSPSQVAQTTHEALGLTFGSKQQPAFDARKEERDLLRQIKILTAAGDKETVKVLQDVLKELRKTGTLPALAP